MQKNAIIFDIQHFSVGDGPGIRTTIFFKDCPLHCAWCHNPEAFLSYPQVMLTNSACQNCGACKEVCPNGCHVFCEGNHTYRMENCIVCGRCITACLSGALRTVGKPYTVDEILAEVLSDKNFYITSGGGVTLSGGECLLQKEFCVELLQRLHKEGIHTAVDTCGYVPKDTLEAILPYTDLFLYDIKAIDEDVHKRCTGADNRRILENLMYLVEEKANIEIRIPYVPGWNECEIPKIEAYLSQLECRPVVRILPYHDYAAEKYAGLGLSYTLPGKLPTEEEIEVAAGLFANN